MRKQIDKLVNTLGLSIRIMSKTTQQVAAMFRDLHFAKSRFEFKSALTTTFSPIRYSGQVNLQ